MSFTPSRSPDAKVPPPLDTTAILTDTDKSILASKFLPEQIVNMTIRDRILLERLGQVESPRDRRTQPDTIHTSTGDFQTPII